MQKSKENQKSDKNINNKYVRNEKRDKVRLITKLLTERMSILNLCLQIGGNVQEMKKWMTWKTLKIQWLLCGFC